MKLYNKAIIAISMLLVGCYYYLEEPDKAIELESSEEPIIELKCNNFDSLAWREFELSRVGKATCQAILICQGFDFKIHEDYSEGFDLIEFDDPAYTMTFCIWYATNGRYFEFLGGVDYVSPIDKKTSFLIPHLESSESYMVRIDCAIGSIIYEKDNMTNMTLSNIKAY